MLLVDLNEKKGINFQNYTTLFSSSYCNMPHGLSSYGLVVLYPCCNNLPWQTGFFKVMFFSVDSKNDQRKISKKNSKENFCLDSQKLKQMF